MAVFYPPWAEVLPGRTGWAGPHISTVQFNDESNGGLRFDIWHLQVTLFEESQVWSNFDIFLGLIISLEVRRRYKILTSFSENPTHANRMVVSDFYQPGFNSKSGSNFFVTSNRHTISSPSRDDTCRIEHSQLPCFEPMQHYFLLLMLNICLISCSVRFEIKLICLSFNFDAGWSRHKKVHRWEGGSKGRRLNFAANECDCLNCESKTEAAYGSTRALKTRTTHIVAAQGI